MTRRLTLARFLAARLEAATVGATVSESGCPRGERRLYTLITSDGNIFETFDIGRIERRLDKLTADIEAMK